MVTLVVIEESLHRCIVWACSSERLLHTTMSIILYMKRNVPKLARLECYTRIAVLVTLMFGTYMLAEASSRSLNHRIDTWMKLHDQIFEPVGSIALLLHQQIFGYVRRLGCLALRC